VWHDGKVNHKGTKRRTWERKRLAHAQVRP
jgi:hypothetical protein